MPSLSKNDLPLLFITLNNLGITLNDEIKTRITTYYNLILKWGTKMALVSKRDLLTGIGKHFLDSFLLLPYIKEEKILVDLGSGAGFPAIPLKIVQPGIKIHLVEARKKKTYFLLEVIRTLNLQDIFVYPKRLEEVDLEADVATSKATGSLHTILKNLDHLLKVGGTLIVYASDKELHPSPSKTIKLFNPLRNNPFYLLFYERSSFS